MADNRSQCLWVVVLVQSGVPVSADAYRDRGSAKKRERLLWRDMDLNDDAVGVFQMKVGRPGSCVCDTASGAELDQFAARSVEA